MTRSSMIRKIIRLHSGERIGFLACHATDKTTLSAFVFLLVLRQVGRKNCDRHLAYLPIMLEEQTRNSIGSKTVYSSVTITIKDMLHFFKKNENQYYIYIDII